MGLINGADCVTTAFPQVTPQQLPGCSNCNRKIVTQCKLLTGKIVVYHVSSETNKIHNPIFFEYLGIGVVYSVMGQLRKSTVRKHFWKRLT